MPAAYHRFARSDAGAVSGDEVARVDALAGRLVAHLDERSDQIDRAHQHAASSSVIQQEVSALLTTALGFREEVVIEPSLGLVTRARPDFYFALGPGRGVLAEVERGGTTTNNHDLKDVWKAHISPSAQHLFLVVPNANWNAARLARERPFRRVVLRIELLRGPTPRDRRADRARFRLRPQRHAVGRSGVVAPPDGRVRFPPDGSGAGASG